MKGKKRIRERIGRIRGIGSGKSGFIMCVRM